MRFQCPHLWLKNPRKTEGNWKTHSPAGVEPVPTLSVLLYFGDPVNIVRERAVLPGFITHRSPLSPLALSSLDCLVHLCWDGATCKRPTRLHHGWAWGTAAKLAGIHTPLALGHPAFKLSRGSRSYRCSLPATMECFICIDTSTFHVPSPAFC